MSKKIIEYGNIPTFVIRCSYCGTLFSYHRSDVYKTRKLGRKMVSCPRCNENLKPTYVEARRQEDE